MSNSNKAPHRPPPLPLNSTILQKYAQDSAPSPQTPRARRNRAGRSQTAPRARSAKRQTFLDDVTPVDAARGHDGGDERDPHDLTLSPKHVTRTSVVDHMLLSLDQFSNPLQSRDPLPDLPYNATNDRLRGNTFSSDHSSEYDPRADTAHIVQQLDRSREGSSHTNSYYRTFQRMPGSYEDEDYSYVQATDVDLQRATAGSLPAGHKKGRMSGKSSNSSSIDLSHRRSGSQPRQGSRRSQSFEYGYNRPRFPIFENESELHNTNLADELDAAPTPVIRAGPSRGQSPVRRGSSAPLSPLYDPTAVGQINNVKPSKAQSSRKARASTMGAATSKSRSQSAILNDNAENFPPMPQHAAPRPHSPFSGQGKLILSLEDVQPPQKEKSGFFRRVFGSRHASAANLQAPETDSRPSRELGTAATSTEGPLPVHTPSSKSQKAKDVTSASTSTPKEHQTLSKKSSAFFRRRKKSMSENVPAPPPVSVQPLQVEPTEPSPISSLRQVMDPYIGNPPLPSPRVEARSDSAQGYYTARTSLVQGQDVAEALRRGSNATQHARQGSKGNHQLKVITQEQQDSTFLADSSGTEEASIKTPKNPSGVDTKAQVGPRSAPHVPPTETSVPVRFPFTSASSSRVSTPPSGARTPHSPPSPTAPDFAPSAKVGKPSKLKLHQMPLDIPKLGGGDTGSPARMSPLRSASDHSVYKSAPSTPLVSIDADAVIVQSPIINITASPETGPRPAHANTKEAREQALKIFDNRDKTLGPGEASAWLGDVDREGVRTAYMDLFDWSNVNILSALRGLCAHIALKGETQQVDRMLDAFSKRWCECNRTHGFKSCGKLEHDCAEFSLLMVLDVVHTICYSTLLLNTDLHLADIEQKMTRTQFIRNTLPTLRRVALDSAAEELGTVRAGTWPRPERASADMPPPLPKSPKVVAELQAGRGSIDEIAPIGSARSSEKVVREADGEHATNDPGPLVTCGFVGSTKAWEAQVEVVLKRIYSSIARERLPLFGAKPDNGEGPASGSLLNITGNMLRRTPSTISKAASEHSRGRAADNRLGAGRWAPKSRSRPPVHPVSTHGSTRTSVDEGSSAWSPSMSSTWSKASQNKTLTSMSVDSFASEGMRADYQKSIGFANALSQAIIREDSAGLPNNGEEGMKAAPLLDDESLELSGAPWAKEGNVKHKHHLEGVDKRAKDRNWTDCFAVIQKGWMRLFSFSVNAKALRLKQKDKMKAGGVFGGGNWMDNAEEVCKFLLRQTIASALPEPGYSKVRPHVWALSLPTGAVHLFQVGTSDIVREFVSTANYWSARLSKEPMTGGTSNMEYGWSDSVINRALIGSELPPAMGGTGPRPSMQSMQSSLRSSIDVVAGSSRPKLPGDKIMIHEWSPPQQSMMASQLMEIDQLRTLQTYVQHVEDDLARHNELRPAMSLAFSQRHTNTGRAMANWERKSSYLLKEIVKFKTYVDVLVGAQREREKVMKERGDRKETGIDNENKTTNTTGRDERRATITGM